MITAISLLNLMLADTEVTFNVAGEHTSPRKVIDIMSDIGVSDFKYLQAPIKELSFIRFESEFGGTKKVLEVTI